MLKEKKWLCEHAQCFGAANITNCRIAQGQAHGSRLDADVCHHKFLLPKAGCLESTTGLESHALRLAVTVVTCIAQPMKVLTKVGL